MTIIRRRTTGSEGFAGSSTTSGQRPAGCPKIGQILIEAGLIDQPALVQCLTVAKQISQPVGRVVSMLGYANERDVQSALVVQSLIGEGKLRKQKAIQSLQEAAKRKIAIVELLKSFGSGVDTSTSTETDLGTLLTESRLITNEQLAHAIAVSEQSELLLCRSLLVTNAITIPVAGKTLHALAQVKAGRMTHIQAVSVLDHVRQTSCSVREAMKQLKVSVIEPTDYLMLGEMIVRSGLSTDIEILGAVETSLIKGKKLGETLVALNIVTEELLESALELQQLSSRCVLGIDESVLVLKRLCEDHLSLSMFALQTDVFQDRSPLAQDVLKLLRASDAINDQVIREALDAKSNYRMAPVKAALATEKLPVALYQSARDLTALVASGKLTEAESIKALLLCRTENLSFASALAAVGRSYTTEAMGTPFEFHQNQTSTATPPVQNRQWFSSGEFLLLIMLGLITPIAGYLCFTYAPAPVNEIGAWAICLIAALGLMLIGISWRHSQKSLYTAARESLDSARDIKVRLAKLRNK